MLAPAAWGAWKIGPVDVRSALDTKSVERLDGQSCQRRCEVCYPDEDRAYGDRRLSDIVAVGVGEALSYDVVSRDILAASFSYPILFQVCNSLKALVQVAWTMLPVYSRGRTWTAGVVLSSPVYPYCHDRFLIVVKGWTGFPNSQMIVRIPVMIQLAWSVHSILWVRLWLSGTSTHDVFQSACRAVRSPSGSIISPRVIMLYRYGFTAQTLYVLACDLQLSRAFKLLPKSHKSFCSTRHSLATMIRMAREGYGPTILLSHVIRCERCRCYIAAVWNLGLTEAVRPRCEGMVPEAAVEIMCMFAEAA